MPKKEKLPTAAELASAVTGFPLWQLGIAELTGHNLEARGRDEVNRLLQQGWILLHVYTLKYQEDGVWRERPMAILGRPGRQEVSDRLAGPASGGPT